MKQREYGIGFSGALQTASSERQARTEPAVCSVCSAFSERRVRIDSRECVRPIRSCTIIVCDPQMGGGLGLAEVLDYIGVAH
jgi:hypothetical protein